MFLFQEPKRAPDGAVAALHGHGVQEDHHPARPLPPAARQHQLQQVGHFTSV